MGEPRIPEDLLTGRVQAADIAWAVIVTGALAFELASIRKSGDLLSDSTMRLCRRHPILGRLTILAVAGHLAVALPPHVDLFNAKNAIHRAIVVALSKRSTDLSDQLPAQARLVG